MKPCSTLTRALRHGRNALALVALLALPAPAQNPDSLNGGFNNTVHSVATQSDGSLLIGGSFTGTRNGLSRLNPDNQTDNAFNPGLNNLFNVAVHSINVQPDGGVLLGGAFTNMGSVPRSRLARLSPDGLADITFNPGANTNVYALATQTDGKILVAGGFTNLAGQACSYLGRLNPDGSLDGSFLPVVNGPVHALLIQTDGKILLGGDFTTVDSISRERLARLDSDGLLDQDFNPGADGTVLCLALQADDKIIVGGNFTNLANQARSRIARLETGGALDNGFAPEVSGEVRSLALQTDGRIFAGGNFTNVSGLVRSNLVRFEATGAVDNYIPNPNAAVFGLGLQADGKLLVGGSFTQIGISYRSRLARLTNEIPATQSLTYASTALTWLRGGSSPEVHRVKFSFSADGVNWIDLPAPTRIAGGWQSSGIVLPANGTFRARGEVRGGYNNSSTWFIESSTGPVAISSQPADQVASAGAQVRFSVTAAGNGPFTYRWYRSGVLVFTSPNSWYTRSASSTEAGIPYDVVISNAVGSVRSRVATFWVPSADSFDPGLVNSVNAILPQPDGSIVAGGAITPLVRFNPNGLIDSTFTASVNGAVNCLAPQPEGKILVGGAFTTVAGLGRNRLARVDSFGRTDPSFNPNASGTVNAFAVLPDGKVLVAGAFLNLGGVSHPYLGRLNADGTPDHTFNPFANGIIHSIAVQPDGMILVGGAFTQMNGTLRNRIARLDADGVLDPSFNPGSIGTAIYCLTLQPDGKILVAGDFTSLGGQSRLRIGRLHATGLIDLGFNPGANAPIVTLQLQADGRIWVGGSFTSIGGQNRNCLVRLNPDGTLDPLIGNGSNSGAILALALQADGKLIAGGSFESLYGTSRTRLGRVNNTSAATQSLSTVGGTTTWLRGGSGPEINRATLDYSTNGADWIELPAPERIAGGWQTNPAVVPAGATLRARGYVNGSFNTGSGYYIENSSGPTAISIQPISQALTFGNTERLIVTASGTGPFTYQWYRNGIAQTSQTNSWFSVPVVTAVYVYEVVVTGPDGSVRSQPTPIWATGADGFNPNADGAVNAIAVQPDQKVLLGGAFTNSPGNRLARLHADGSRDTTFAPVISGGTVASIAVQRDGKILIGGFFTNINGQTRNAIGRLHGDGSLDLTFNPGAAAAGGFYGPIVRCLAIQSDGQILVGGSFEFLAGQSRYCLGRLNTNGTLDASFVPPLGGGGPPDYELGVFSLILEPGGNVLTFGELKEADPSWTTYAQRLDSSGNRMQRIFADYSPGGPPPPPTYIMCAATQPDGSIILGGWFDWIESGQLHRNLARIDPSGALDLTFTNIADAPVTALAVQADGRILVGGVFSSLAGQARQRLGRLNANGSLDTAFDAQLTGSAEVEALAIQPDGRILVGGSFTNLATRTRNNIGRLNNLELGADSLSQDGGNFIWQHSNVSPEVTSAILEASPDGIHWDYLGAGTRVPGGWQWFVFLLQADALVRARGFVGGGESFWFAENYVATAPRTVPTILTTAASLGFSSNSFGLFVAGSFGHLGVVDASTNLVNWTPIQTNRFLGPPTFFNDVNATNFPRRFYRARLP